MKYATSWRHANKPTVPLTIRILRWLIPLTALALAFQQGPV